MELVNPSPMRKESGRKELLAQKHKRRIRRVFADAERLQPQTLEYMNTHSNPALRVRPTVPQDSGAPHAQIVCTLSLSRLRGETRVGVHVPPKIPNPCRPAKEGSAGFEKSRARRTGAEQCTRCYCGKCAAGRWMGKTGFFFVSRGRGRSAASGNITGLLRCGMVEGTPG